MPKGGRQALAFGINKKAALARGRVRQISPCACLQPAEQNQDEDNHQHDSEHAHSAMAVAIAVAAAEAAIAAEQHDEQDDDENKSERHAMISLLRAVAVGGPLIERIISVSCFRRAAIGFAIGVIHLSCETEDAAAKKMAPLPGP